MTLRKIVLGLFVGFGISAVAVAQAPAGAPAGSTGICKDGTYSTQANKQGACRGHKGIQTWYEASAATPAAPAAAKPSATVSSAKATPAPQAAGPAPAGATGMCKDGTYSMQANKQGACRGHQGIQTWFAASAAPASAPAPAAKAMPTPAPAPAARTMPAPTPAAAPAAMPAPAATPNKRLSPTQAAAQKPQTPGGGPGLVWVNTESNVYHCNGDAFYGKTKAGAYMSEADAKAKGARPERNKPCTGK